MKNNKIKKKKKKKNNLSLSLAHAPCVGLKTIGTIFYDRRTFHLI